jgi:polyhydroxyalkanoate synthase
MVEFFGIVSVSHTNRPIRNQLGESGFRTLFLNPKIEVVSQDDEIKGAIKLRGSDARSSYMTNDLPTFEGTMHHLQLDMMDTLRQMQGHLFASLGFGPEECPYRVIVSESHWRLREYGDHGRSAAVLIVAAPIKRPYIWDLTPSVSVVRRCLGAGLAVYLLEWLPASEKAGHVGIAECLEAISQALAKIASNKQGAKPVLMGHSLGGTLAAIYAASASSTIGRLVLLQSPMCFGEGNDSFRDALISLVPDRVSDLEPYPGSLLSLASAMAAPETFVWSRQLDMIRSLSDSDAMNLHTRIERWSLDEVSLPGKLVSEIVELLYRENQFCRGILKIGERVIGPEDIAVPTFVVVNSADAVAPLESARPIAEASQHIEIVESPEETGVCFQHLGVLVGRQAHAQVWPRIIDWMVSPALCG